jgi:hypothetical protein
MVGSCEHSIEPSGSIRREFVDQLSEYYLLKDSAPWSELEIKVLI